VRFTNEEAALESRAAGFSWDGVTVRDLQNRLEHGLPEFSGRKTILLQVKALTGDRGGRMVEKARNMGRLG